MYTASSLVKKLSYHLQDALNACTLRWKGTEKTDEYVEKKPTVYAFTYDNLSDGLPIDTPCVLVQVTRVSDGVVSIAIHCAVCNPATQDKEITKAVLGESEIFEYLTTSDIDTSCVRSELYRACLDLGEYIYTSIHRMDNNSWSFENIVLTPPSPYMEYFPYCECIVTFDASLPEIDSVLDTKVAEFL